MRGAAPSALPANEPPHAPHACAQKRVAQEIVDKGGGRTGEQTLDDLAAL